MREGLQKNKNIVDAQVSPMEQIKAIWISVGRYQWCTILTYWWDFGKTVQFHKRFTHTYYYGSDYKKKSSVHEMFRNPGIQKITLLDIMGIPNFTACAIPQNTGKHM